VTDLRHTAVAIRPWAGGDLWLLERLLGAPGMTRYIGGPESLEAIAARHERYLASDPATNGLFAITLGTEGPAVGWVGYWESTWRGETVWECGWHVLPEAQGGGVARAGAELMLQDLRRRGTHRHLHAFPSVDNAASNALCRALGFECLGDVEVEYPRGSMMHSNDWRFDLDGEAEGGARRQDTTGPPLACPVCDEPLRRLGAAFACAAGHAFDVAKEGYVNLLVSQHRSRGIDGDSREMLQARRRFLEAGHFAPLREALVEETDAVLAGRRSEAAPTVIEVGCGEGYYIGGVGERVAATRGAQLLGTDLSKAAVRVAATRYPGVVFFVADVHKRIYVRTGSSAVLLDVFAPRDAAEFARILEPGGCALIVIPTDSHLGSVRRAFGLLDVQPEKERRLLERFAGAFRLVERREIRYGMELSPQAVGDLIAMGPNARHRRDAAAVAEPIETEASFVLLRLERGEGPVCG